MNEQKPNIYYHLPVMIISTLLVMMVVEYYGWEIVKKTTGEWFFPGFFSWSFAGSVFANTLSAFLFGLLATLAAFCVPSFRKKWKTFVHIPVWIGVILFSICMIILVGIGLLAA